MTDNQEKVVEPSNVVELPDNIKPEDFQIYSKKHS
jgi:hypothetical protein